LGVDEFLDLPKMGAANLAPPILLGFTLHRWRIRIFDLNPMRRANMASAFHYFTGLQYLVATDDEVGVSATSQKTSALPFCRNMPAPRPAAG
jgi:hypothetical protein